MENRICHPGRIEAKSGIPWSCLEVLLRDLIRSLPARLACGLPVHVAASLAAPFSTLLGMTASVWFGKTRAYKKNREENKFSSRVEVRCCDPEEIRGR